VPQRLALADRPPALLERLPESRPGFNAGDRDAVRLREAELLGERKAGKPKKGCENSNYAGKFPQTHP